MFMYLVCNKEERERHQENEGGILRIRALLQITLFWSVDLHHQAEHSICGCLSILSRPDTLSTSVTGCAGAENQHLSSASNEKKKMFKRFTNSEVNVLHCIKINMQCCQTLLGFQLFIVLLSGTGKIGYEIEQGL